MATIDQELRKAKKNIDEATETIVKNKAAEVEELHSKLQTFNGKYVPRQSRQRAVHLSGQLSPSREQKEIGVKNKSAPRI